MGWPFMLFFVKRDSLVVVLFLELWPLGIRITVPIAVDRMNFFCLESSIFSFPGFPLSLSFVPSSVFFHLSLCGLDGLG